MPDCCNKPVLCACCGAFVAVSSNGLVIVSEPFGLSVVCVHNYVGCVYGQRVRLSESTSNGNS